MKPNPFFSGFVCGVALTLASVVVFITYQKEITPAAPHQVNPLIPASGTIRLAVPQAAQAVPAASSVSSPSRGPANAPVTVTEFADFYCGFCKKAFPTVMQIVKNYPDKVRLVFKNSPLAVTPGQGSYFVHEAGVCAAEQGKFWEFFEAAYSYSGHPDPAAVRQIASQIGLSAPAFESCLKSDRPKKVIEADLREGASKSVDGTPTFFINGQVLSGAYPYENFKTIIDGILSGKAPAAAVPAPAAPQPPRIVEFNDLKGRPSMGPENAPVTLVEFSDFHCPFCKKLEPTMKQVMQNYPTQVRRVWRHFPLPMHKGSDRTHQAAECANQQGKFWDYESRLFDNFSTPKDEAFYTTIAEQSGLKMKDFKKCMEGAAAKDIVQNDIKKGGESGVTGTPAVFVNGRLLKGAQPYDSIKRVIDEEIQKKAAQPSKK